MSLPPSPTKPSREHQTRAISIAMVFFFGDLMVDLAVVVWVVDSAFSGIVWVMG